MGFYFDDKKLENVNKGERIVSNHVELWVKNAFDESKQFHGFDTVKSVIGLCKDEYSINNLVDMLLTFVLQVTEENATL